MDLSVHEFGVPENDLLLDISDFEDDSSMDSIAYLLSNGSEMIIDDEQFFNQSPDQFDIADIGFNDANIPFGHSDFFFGDNMEMDPSMALTELGFEEMDLFDIVNDTLKTSTIDIDGFIQSNEDLNIVFGEPNVNLLDFIYSEEAEKDIVFKPAENVDMTSVSYWTATEYKSKSADSVSNTTNSAAKSNKEEAFSKAPKDNGKNKIKRNKTADEIKNAEKERAMMEKAKELARAIKCGNVVAKPSVPEGKGKLPADKKPVVSVEHDYASRNSKPISFKKIISNMDEVPKKTSTNVPVSSKKSPVQEKEQKLKKFKQINQKGTSLLDTSRLKSNSNFVSGKSLLPGVRSSLLRNSCEIKTESLKVEPGNHVGKSLHRAEDVVIPRTAAIHVKSEKSAPTVNSSSPNVSQTVADRSTNSSRQLIVHHQNMPLSIKKHPSVRQLPNVQHPNMQKLHSMQQLQNMQKLPNMQKSPNVQQFQDVQKSPNVQQFLAVQKSPNVQQFQDVQKSPNMQQFLDVQKSPNVQQLHVVQKSPNVQQFQDVQKSPNVQQFQDVQKSPNVQQFLDVQKSPNMQQLQSAQQMQNNDKDSNKKKISLLDYKKIRQLNNSNADSLAPPSQAKSETKMLSNDHNYCISENKPTEQQKNVAAPNSANMMDDDNNSNNASDNNKVASISNPPDQKSVDLSQNKDMNKEPNENYFKKRKISQESSLSPKRRYSILKSIWDDDVKSPADEQHPDLPAKKNCHYSNSAGCPSDASSSTSSRKSRSRSSFRSASSSSSSSSDDCEYKRSRSRSRRRSKSRSSRCKNRRNRNSSRTDVEQKKAKEERRIVYVGGIPSDYTSYDLERKLQTFGNITKTTIHTNDEGECYGFVTFEKTDAAASAKQGGNKLPGFEKCYFSYGGRRAFCETKYADLDYESVRRGSTSKKDSKSNDFQDLLKQAMSMVQKSKRKS